MLSPTSDHEYPGVRCTVISLPYTNARLGLNGLYCGEMDVVSKLPDGNGILYCSSGQMLQGEWCLGRLILLDDPTKARQYNEDSLRTSCDNSTCSSLSVSITGRLSSTGEARPKTKIKVPKNLYVIKSGPSDMISFGKTEMKVMERGSTIPKVQNTQHLYDVFEKNHYNSNTRPVNTAKSTSFKPFISKVKRTFNKRW